MYIVIYHFDTRKLLLTRDRTSSVSGTPRQSVSSTSLFVVNASLPSNLKIVASLPMLVMRELLNVQSFAPSRLDMDIAGGFWGPNCGAGCSSMTGGTGGVIDDG